MDARVDVKERRALYEACIEKGTAIGMSRYAIEEAIELRAQSVM